jgi:hypothetical protein
MILRWDAICVVIKYDWDANHDKRFVLTLKPFIVNEACIFSRFFFI